MSLLDMSGFAADFLALLEACIDTECKYKFLRSRGLPPLECNYIAVSFGDELLGEFSNCSDWGDCETEISTYEFNVYLAIGDVTPLVNKNYGFDVEDVVTACFYNDLTQLKQCVLCTDYSTLKIDYNIASISSLRVDIRDHQGGAFVATVRMRLEVNECCPSVP